MIPESAQIYTALRVQVGQSTSSSGIAIGNITAELAQSQATLGL